MVFLHLFENNLGGWSHFVQYRQSKPSGLPFEGAKVGQILGIAPLKVDGYYMRILESAPRVEKMSRCVNLRA